MVRVGRGGSWLVASGVLLLMLGLSPAAQAESAVGYRQYGSPASTGSRATRGSVRTQRP